MVSGLWHAVRELPVPVPVGPSSPGPEAPPGPQAPPGAGAAVSSFVLGVAGACILLLTIGLLSPFSTPLSAVAWGLGRRARRGGATGGHRSLAVAGEVLGAIGTILGALAAALLAQLVL